MEPPYILNQNMSPIYSALWKEFIYPYFFLNVAALC